MTLAAAPGPVARRPAWRRRAVAVAAYQAPVLMAVGVALLVPTGLALAGARDAASWRAVHGFAGPAAVALGLGALARRRRQAGPATLTQTDALLVTTAAWIVTTALGALPYGFVLGVPWLDAVFESASGFATAGTTMLVGLDGLPPSVLLWRGLTQWLGGLGILLLVLLIGRSRGSEAFSLLNAEGVAQVGPGRLALNFRVAVERFTLIYVALTVAQIVLYRFLGLSGLDSVVHAMTTTATGGFSTHDASVAFFRQDPAAFPRFAAIERVIAVFMLAGSINFYAHFRLVRGDVRALWDGLEMRLFWAVLGLATAVTAASVWLAQADAARDWVWVSFFTVASLMSTTGFEIVPAGEFPRLAREVFLFLMVVGGAAGSTAGGIKLIRLGLLGKLIAHELAVLRLPPHAVRAVQVDGRPVSDRVFRQVAFLFLAWMAYVAASGLVISVQAPDLEIGDAYAVACSALGGSGRASCPWRASSRCRRRPSWC